MRLAAYATTGFIAESLFVFTNVLDGLAERLDVEESFIFFDMLLASAIFGSERNHDINVTATRRRRYKTPLRGVKKYHLFRVPRSGTS